MVGGYVSRDEVLFVNVGWGLRFWDEDLNDVWEGFDEAFGGFVRTKVVVEGLASDGEALDSVPDQYTIAGHFSGEVLVCLDLNNPFNGLYEHRDFTVVGDVISIVLQA